MIESSVIDSLLPYILPLDSPILAGASVSGGTFIATTIFHPVGENFFQVQLSEIPTTIDAAGWSALINDVPTTVTFISVSGAIATFGIGTMQVDDEIYVSYDGAGNTIFEGTQLKAFTDVKASNPLTGETRWLAGGSPFMLTDGDITTGDAHVMHGQFIGEGSPAFVTPADMHLPDFEGVYREVAQNTAPWYGGRVVRNLMPVSQDFSNAAWGKSNLTLTAGIADPFGGTDAFTVTATAANGSLSDDTGSNAAVCVNSIWARRVTGTGIVYIRPANGGYTDITAELDGTWKRFTASGAGANTGRNGIFITDSGDEVDVAFAQQEDADGQTNQNPSEYIPTTSAPVTRHYDNENGNTVLNNVVTEAEGAQIDPAPSLYAAPAAENRILYSRDYLQAAWVNSTCDIAANIVGLDGTPNTGYTLTQIVNNNDTLAQSITGSVEIQVARVIVRKSDSNSTQVRLGVDGQYLTFNSVTGEFFSSSADDWAIIDHGDILEAYCQNDVTAGVVTIDLDVDRSGITGAHVGVLQFDCYSGKTIDQVKGLYPIFTEGAAVSNAAIQLPYDIANHSNGQGAYYCEWTGLGADFSSGASRTGFIQTGGNSMLYSGSNVVNSYDGVSVANKSASINGSTTPFRFALAYGSGNKQVNVDGVYGTETAYDGDFQANFNAVSLIGKDNSMAAISVGLIRNVRRYDLPYAEAKAKIDELMAL